MSEQPEATILIPNYKTLLLTKLCLRSLRRYTSPGRVRVIVIDNDSQDESTEYLRTVKWITLVERKTTGENGPQMHAHALDEAMSLVTTPYVIAFHTDTIVTHPQWLDFLLAKLQSDPQNAGVGSWKLEYISPLKAFGKRLEDGLRRLMGREIHSRDHYFRTHCVLYKTELVRETKGFTDPATAGLSLFNTLRDKGYRLPFISSAELSRYMLHLNHATALLNDIHSKGNDLKHYLKRKSVERSMANLSAGDLLEDDSLDQ